MAGFRNVVVHEYGDVDLEVVDEVLKNREYRRLLEIALRMKQRAKDYWDP